MYLYIHNKYTPNTHIMQTKTFILDAINHLTYIFTKKLKAELVYLAKNQ